MNYRKAKPGEVTCGECRHRIPDKCIRPFPLSDHLCALDGDFAVYDWTCDRAEKEDK